MIEAVSNVGAGGGCPYKWHLDCGETCLGIGCPAYVERGINYGVEMRMILQASMLFRKMVL